MKRPRSSHTGKISLADVQQVLELAAEIVPGTDARLSLIAYAFAQGCHRMEVKDDVAIANITAALAAVKIDPDMTSGMTPGEEEREWRH